MAPAAPPPLAPVSEWGYVLYGVAGRRLWHQRLLLGTVQGSSASEYPEVTPDADIYLDDLGGTDPDIMATRVGTERWPPPLGLSANEVYRFAREPSAAQRAGSGKFGDTVFVGTAGGPTLGSYSGRRGWVQCAGGAHDVFCALLAVTEVDHFKRTFRGSDARTLPVITGATGRLRDWRSVVADSREEGLADFPVMDPRTTKWCAQYQMRDGGPILHHEMWKSRRRLQVTDRGVATHGVLSQVVEYLGRRNQCDIYNLLGAEIAYHHLQLVEHYYDERAAEHAQGRVTTDETVAFMGINRSASMVWPSLLDSVSKELERVSGIKKNARKLREDQMAQAKAKNKKKRTKDHDDE